MYARPQTYALPNQLESPLRDKRLSFFPTAAMFLLGTATGYPIQVVGRIYPGELALALIALVAFIGLFSMPKSLRSQVLILLGAMLIGFIGYVLSDIYRGTEVKDYVRGWSRWVFMILNFLALVKLTYRQPKYLLAFMLGFSAVNGALPFLSPGLSRGFLFTWKFYLSVPISIFAVWILGNRHPKTTALCMFGLAVLNAGMDYRSMALVCLLTAGLVYLAGKVKDSGGSQLSLRATGLIWAALTLCMCVWGAIFIVQKYAEIHNLSDRQVRSSTRRLAIAKSTFEIIGQSPFIGYGSWARNPQLAKLQDKMIEKLKAVDTRGELRKDVVIAHSQVLQTWIEGGILGVLFCIVFGFQLGFAGVNLGLRRPYNALVPFYAFILWNSTWHLLFSPFKGTQRIFIPVACVVIVQIAYDMSLLRSVSSAREWLQNYWRQAMAPRPNYGQVDAH